MQDAQQGTLNFARASRDARIDALPVNQRIRRLLRALDRILLMLLEAGADNAYVDDGQTLVGEIDVGLIAQIMGASLRTARSAIAEARDGLPWIEIQDQRGRANIFAIHWRAIPELQGSDLAPLQKLQGCNPPVAGVSSQVAGVLSEVAGVQPLSKDGLSLESPSPTEPNSLSKSISIDAGGLESSGEDVGDGPRAEAQGPIWGSRLSSEELTTPRGLAVLYATALEQGVIVPDDMSVSDWFAWGHYCTTARGVVNPVGLFTAQLTGHDRFKKTWREKIRAEDRAWAEREMRQGIGPKEAQAIRLAIAAAVRRSPHAKARIAGAECLGKLTK